MEHRKPKRFYLPHEVPEVSFGLHSVEVTAETRPLRAQWTPELADELEGFHSVDAEQELTAVLRENLAQEIDREIIGGLQDAANRVGEAGRGGGANYIITNPEIASMLEDLRYEWSFIKKPKPFIMEGEGHSMLAGLTGGGMDNHVVGISSRQRGRVNQNGRVYPEGDIMSYDIVADPGFRDAVLEHPEPAGLLPHVRRVAAQTVAQDLVPVQSMGPPDFVMGIDPYEPIEEPFLKKPKSYDGWLKKVGIKGETFMESGYVYAPYIPLMMIPPIVSGENFTPREGIMTRYAQRLVNNSFYGRIAVGDT